PLVFDLGPRLRWLGLVTIAGYAVAAVVAPLVSVGWWMRRGGVASLAGMADSLGASAWSAGLAVAPAVVVGAAVAVVAERSRRGRSLARLVDLGFALPGLVVGLGLTFLILRLAPSLHQTWLPY